MAALERDSHEGSPRVVVIGAGPLFLSGISYYTHHLASALAGRATVSVILLRRLLPLRFYPGRERVGRDLVEFSWDGVVDLHDGVDWFWLRSLRPALRLLRRARPDLVVLQWWTGTVLHTLLLLALVARRGGAKVVIEFHEVQDVGELGIPLAGRYVELVLPLLARLADGYVVHSEFDREALVQRFSLGDKPVCKIPHPVYDAYRSKPTERREVSEAAPWTLLYFGIIRPFKGVEDLIRAFDGLTDEEVKTCRLVVVGETWEGWTLPGELIAASPHRERITFVNRYVPDSEVADFFDAADVVVLPYHRSSSSGPLQIAMGSGKQVIVSAVGGLVAAVEGYPDAQLVEPQSPESLLAAIRASADQHGTTGSARPFTFDDAAVSMLAFAEELTS